MGVAVADHDAAPGDRPVGRDLVARDLGASPACHTQSPSLGLGGVGGDDVVRHREPDAAIDVHPAASTENVALAGAALGDRVAPDGVVVNCGRAEERRHAAAPVTRVGVDVISSDRGSAVAEVDAASKVGGVAEYLAVADRGRRRQDIHPPAGVGSPGPLLTDQPSGISAGDAQSFDHRADVTGDKEHTPLALRVQRGRLGEGIRCRPVGDGVPAGDGDVPGDVDDLGDGGEAAQFDDVGRGDGTGVHAGVDAGGDLDHLARRIDGIHCGLDVAVAGGGPAARSAGRDIVGLEPIGSLGAGDVRCTAAQQPEHSHGQSEAEKRYEDPFRSHHLSLSALACFRHQRKEQDKHKQATRPNLT